MENGSLEIPELRKCLKMIHKFKGLQGLNE